MISTLCRVLTGIATTYIKRQLISGDNSNQATTHINCEKTATNHIKIKMKHKQYLIG